MTTQISREEIINDIRVFEIRLHKAQNSLAKLPDGYLPYPEYKKRERQRMIYRKKSNTFNI